MGDSAQHDSASETGISVGFRDRLCAGMISITPPKLLGAARQFEQHHIRELECMLWLKRREHCG